MKKAIMISANIEQPEEKYGSVLHHSIHLGRHGCVFWHINIPGTTTSATFKHPEILKAYFYVTSVQKVLYVCDVDFIGSIEELDEKKNLIQYVPQWRKDDWKKSLKNPHGFWVLITEIRELNPPKEFQHFINFEKKRPLEAVPQTYSIIDDPEYDYI